MAERRLSPADAAWLYSEWNKNNQTVSSLMWLDRQVDPQDYIDIVQERIVDRYPTFRQRIRPSRNPLLMPHWEDGPDFDIAHHVEVIELRGGDKEELRALASEHLGQLLDRNRPLWKMFIIQGYRGTARRSTAGSGTPSRTVGPWSGWCSHCVTTPRPSNGPPPSTNPALENGIS